MSWWINFQFSEWDSSSLNLFFAFLHLSSFNSLYEILRSISVSSVARCAMSFNSLYEIHEALKARVLEALKALSILFMRFPATIGEIYESLQDNFQFSLWDSGRGLSWSVSSHQRSTFQFSLWDSIKVMSGTSSSALQSFNSLYEILFLCLALLVFGLKDLSILFMRFLHHTYPDPQASSRKTFNSLYEILVRPQAFMSSSLRLSILFMRFCLESGLRLTEALTFNSLYEILLMVLCRRQLRCKLPFNSLYEIPKALKQGHYSYPCSFLSILFMRFRKEVHATCYSSNKENFQFSLWDSWVKNGLLRMLPIYPPFNSLYEIQPLSIHFPGTQSPKLSILFMRFEQKGETQIGPPPPLFQFSLWDSFEQLV